MKVETGTEMDTGMDTNGDKQTDARHEVSSTDLDDWKCLQFGMSIAALPFSTVSTKTTKTHAI